MPLQINTNNNTNFDLIKLNQIKKWLKDISNDNLSIPLEIAYKLLQTSPNIQKDTPTVIEFDSIFTRCYHHNHLNKPNYF